ncbi:helix-turn-helix transcriptional regulator [Biostraticola tofi]|uniref:Regulatory LuxR family protein n=1 Tax=Biostraticola tofi TaxID=466109 RepID=A0A4R3Z4R4_9GAMM|nr:PAS domain-containing protein [Biostraticola tofi]TCW00173.1 regulatory LuxR family protein [Biostraticola tofi]
MDNILNNQNVVSTMISIIENLNEPWGIKDAASRHVYMNNAARLYTSTPQNFAIEGKSDRDFPAAWSELAAGFIEHDKLAEQADKSVSVIETDFWYGKNELQPYLSEKIPLKTFTGDCMGTLWNAREIRLLSPMVCIGRKKSSILHTRTDLKIFTKCELDVIFLMLKRLSSKEISKLLEKSVNTITNRISIIYQKADVHSIIQLEEYCKTNNLDNYIPPSLLNKGISFI